MSLSKYFLVAIAMCWLLTACKTLEIDVEHTSQPITPKPASPMQTPRPLTFALTSTPAVNAYSGTPQEGVIYLGEVAGENAVFIHHHSDFANPYLGVAWYFERGGLPFEPLGYLTRGKVEAESPFDFRNLSRPVATHANGLNVGRIFDVQRSAKLIDDNSSQLEKDFLYLGLTGQVIEIDLANPQQWRLLWQHDPAKDSPGLDVDVLIDQTAGPLQVGGDRYLVLRLLPCCEPYPPHDVLILNAKTGKDLYLGKVGNVHIDYIEKVVSYQELGSLRKKAEPCPFCDPDGYVTLYAPTGNLLKQPLP